MNLPPEADYKRFYDLSLELVTRFINLPLIEMDNAIQISLKELSAYVHADRAYVFTYDFVQRTATNTHEWCAEGIEPQIHELQSTPMDFFPEWLEQHLKNQPFIIHNIEEMPEGNLKQILLAQSIQSLIATPLFYNQECLGFVGLDSVRTQAHYGEYEIRLLNIFSQLLVSLLIRRQHKDSLLQAASVFEHAYEGIIITDPNGQILNCNKAYQDITGFELNEILNKPVCWSNCEEGQEFDQEVIWPSLHQHGYWSGELKSRRKTGEHYVVRETIRLVNTQENQPLHYIGFLKEITEFKLQQKQLKRLTHYDALTQLPNRHFLTEKLKRLMTDIQATDSQLAILFIDLDGFKSINDHFSHAIGNELLVRLAQRMISLLPQPNDVLARLGGDEFAITTTYTDYGLLIQFIELLISELALPFEVNGHNLYITASIGVTLYPQNDQQTEPDQLIRQADHAMYHAKRAGKNRYEFFDNKRDQMIRGQHQNFKQIEQALIDNQFELFYQPKVHLRSGRLIGWEALIRWNHPEKGYLQPGQFLPMIEGHELTIRLGEWVIQKALKQLQRQRKTELASPISINIHAVHLQHPQFVERLQQMIQAYPEFQPGELELEILETAALEDISQVSNLINQCREIGVHFSLDDFGTGYSSLTYLKRLKADTLKIDLSFVRDMLEDTDDLAILDGIIGLATAFQRQVIAEGVETLEHIEFLLRLGCEQGQGYYIAKPMPVDTMSTWLQLWSQTYKSPNPPRTAQDKLPILYAIIEHKIWVHQIRRFAHDHQLDLPALSTHECPLGKWLDHDALLTHDNTQLHPVIELHEQIHQIAEQLIYRKKLGQINEVESNLTQIELLRDQLVSQLKKMIDS
jgi:diguanylate cyclase (GGDEF)-like protein/PAS domain S-box-containing protein